mgnify:CR=1 FL=1
MRGKVCWLCDKKIKKEEELVTLHDAIVGDIHVHAKCDREAQERCDQEVPCVVCGGFHAHSAKVCAR